GAIVYSGVVNLGIPNDFYGIYLNIATGGNNTGAAATAGWDINPYFAGSSLFQATGAGYVASGGAATNLTPGTTIDGSSTFASSPSSANFTPGTPGLLGVKFTNEGTGMTDYGWVRMTVGR